MKNYELAVLIAPDLSDEAAKSLQERTISLIQELGGILNGDITLFKKNLAYPVKKHRQAHFLLLNFQLEAEKLTSIEKKLKDEKEFLRFTIMVKAPVSTKPIRTRPFKSVIKKPLLTPQEKKVELKEIEEKLAEILE